MANRRSEIAMAPAEIRDYLAEARLMTVATLLPDGRPHLVAMAYTVIDRQVAFVSYERSQKVANLRRDPRLTLLVDSGDTYSEYRGVQLLGAARIVHETEQVLDLMHRVALQARVNEPTSTAVLPPELEAQAPKRVGVFVDVDRVISWDHRKLGGTY